MPHCLFRSLDDRHGDVLKRFEQPLCCWASRFALGIARIEARQCRSFCLQGAAHDKFQQRQTCGYQKFVRVEFA